MRGEVGFDLKEKNLFQLFLIFVKLAWLDALRRPLDFKGRTSRSAFAVVSTPFYFALFGFPVFEEFFQHALSPVNFQKLEAIWALCLIPLFLMLLPIIFRRLHDSGRSFWGQIANPFGWFMTTGFFIVAAPFFKGEEGENKFGPPHKVIDQLKKKDPRRIG